MGMQRYTAHIPMSGEAGTLFCRAEYDAGIIPGV